MSPKSSSLAIYELRESNKKQIKYPFYIDIKTKFFISFYFAMLWLALSIYISIPWIRDLSEITTPIVAIIIITGVAYIPGYMNAFLVVSLILDKQPKFRNEYPSDNVTLLVSAYNEEKGIYDTLKYVAKQDYNGNVLVIVIDNNSSDNTTLEIERAKKELGLNIKTLQEKKQGKFNALNLGLKYVSTDYVITLDADTLLHKSAIRYLVARMKSAPNDVCAVAGSVLVKNTRDNILSKVQEWDYFLSISSIKRMQGLYQGTLVAQGAYSLYKTDVVKSVGGWSDAIGEDIVLTWKMLEKNYRVYFEPMAVAFTDVPTNLVHFARQRSRWARGMIEGIREVRPWKQPSIYSKYLTGLDLIIPYMDISYTLFWIPGLVLALFGRYYIVGPMAILVLPMTLLSFGILYMYQKNNVFDKLNLKVRKNIMGFLVFIFFYQVIMSPISVRGYVQEILKTKRVWK